MLDMTGRIIMDIRQCSTRDEVVEHYQHAMHIVGIDWARINKEIIETWSKSGLKNIKKKAWTLDNILN